MDTQNKKKLTNISIIRLISVLLIVSCHFFQYYGKEVAFKLNIGVQFFLIISGFLYGLKFEKIDCKKSLTACKKIYFDFFLFCIIAIVLFLCCGVSIKPQDILFQFTMVITLWGLGHLWYVPLVILCYLMMPFLKELCVKIIQIKNKYVKFITTLFLFVACLLLLCNKVTLSPIEWILCFIISFVTTALYKDASKTLKLVALAVVLILCCGLHFVKFYRVEEYANLIEKVDIYGFRFDNLVRCLSAYGSFYALYWLLKPLNNLNVNSKLLNFSDKYSYDLYLCHQIFILGPISILALGFENKFIAIVCALLAIIGLFIFFLAFKWLITFLLKKIKTKLKNEK